MRMVTVGNFLSIILLAGLLPLQVVAVESNGASDSSAFVLVDAGKVSDRSAMGRGGKYGPVNKKYLGDEEVLRIPGGELSGREETRPDVPLVEAEPVKERGMSDVGKKPGFLKKILHSFAGDGNVKMRVRAAENFNTPVSVLENLAYDENVRVRVAVAQNPNAPIEVLRLLAGDKNGLVRIAVANNLNTPSDILQLLVRDSLYRVRLGVAGNPNTSQGVLRFLIEDSHKKVRVQIAKNPSTPEDVLQVLAESGDSSVRKSMEDNPALPENVRRTISKQKEGRGVFGRIRSFFGRFFSS